MWSRRDRRTPGTKGKRRSREEAKAGKAQAVTGSGLVDVVALVEQKQRALRVRFETTPECSLTGEGDQAGSGATKRGFVEIERGPRLAAEVVGKLAQDLFGGCCDDDGNALGDGVVGEQTDHSALAGAGGHLNESARALRIEMLNTEF